MKKILCPTDFSDAAHNAIGYAAKFAKAAHASLTLFHVQSVFDLTPVEIVEGGKARMRAVAQQLEAQAGEVHKTFRIACDALAETSYQALGDALHDAAGGYDLMVMGTNGADDLFQFFNGSNAYNAVVKADIPMLLVPAACTYAEVKTVVFAYDYLRERKLPLQPLAAFTQTLQAKIIVLQVMEEATSADANEELIEWQFILKALYADNIDIAYDTVRSADIADGIRRYMAGGRAEMLALCTKHRNVLQRFFHKSVVKRMASLPDYPLFVFH